MKSSKEAYNPYKHLLPVRCDKSNPGELPQRHASLLSYMTNHWLTPLMWTAYRKGLTPGDLYHTPPEDSANFSGDRFDIAWQNEVKHKGAEKASLFWVILKLSAKSFFASIFCIFIFNFCGIMLPIFFVNRLLHFAELENYDDNIAYGVKLLLGMALVEVCRSLFLTTAWTINNGAAIQMRAGVLTSLFRKILRLHSLKNTSTGELINLCSNDGQRIFEAVHSGNFIVGCLVAIVAAAMSMPLVGSWGILGFVVYFSFLPLQVVMSRSAAAIRAKTLVHTDMRVKLISEILTCIKLVKMYAWEKSFASKVSEVRKKEENENEKFLFMSSLIIMVPSFMPLLASVVTFLAVTLSRNDLSAVEAFTFISLLNSIRMTLAITPVSAKSLTEAMVACKRIKVVLLMEEKKPILRLVHEAENAIEIVDGGFTWETDSESKGQHVDQKKNGEEKEKLMHSKMQSAEETMLANSLTLLDINLDIRKGQLYGICGSVGSGKSSLLSAILGQMNKVKGELAVSGSTAYVAQQAWIMNATVKDNIVFGLPFEAARYNLAIEVCALQSDLDLLPAGDETEVGERGINLSGGQKQRISLARAVYNNSDIYLLDDPLSAVDAHVALHIFDSCIAGALVGKTVVFVTHQLQFLRSCNFIVVMKEGKMLESGTHEQLMSVESEYRTLIETYHTQEKQSNSNEAETDADELCTSVLESEPESWIQSPDGIPRQEFIWDAGPKSISESQELLGLLPSGEPRWSSAQEGLDKAEHEVCHSDTASIQHEVNEIAFKAESCTSIHAAMDSEKNNENGPRKHLIPGAKLISAEVMAKGAIAWDTYKYYMLAGGGWFFFFIVIFVMVLWMASASFANWWLSYWLQQGSGVDAIKNGTSVERTGAGEEKLSDYDNMSNNPELEYYAVVYGLTTACVLVMLFLKSLLFSKWSVRASSHLHEVLFQKVLRLPMSYFDVTLSGQTINRFSKDMDEIDLQFPATCEHLIINALLVLNSLIMISLVLPYMLLVTIPLVVVVLLLNTVIRSGVRGLKRLDIASRSPWFSHVATTVQGLSTIQAYSKEQHFMLRFNTLVDNTSMPLFLFNNAMRWAAVRLELITVTVTITTAAFVMFLPRDLVKPAYAALALSYAMSMSGLFQYTVRLFIETESRFTSAERVISDIKTLETEAPAVLPLSRPAADWPNRGEITFENVCLKYRPELPLILNNVSFVIKPSEKIGIVGRTGAGKSSLGVALFRLTEIISGAVTIDGWNISKIGLEDLRCKLSIIPQDPSLFKGTVRYNLDPFGSHTDEELWLALEKCHIKRAITSLENRLETTVMQGGENFSVGERQLLCMARALLRHSRVLVLDEATAAIDTETDHLIQETIRDVFTDCTLLIIAHRLDTVMSCDRVMVLDEGQILEFDSPVNLLAEQDSFFSRMVKVQEARATDS